ncbi:MAG: hypothetical protein AAF376_19710 [Pseudomonadota bacterium]
MLTDSNATTHSNDQLAMHFLAVRQGVGLLGLILPTVLLIYAGGASDRMQPTISDFYYTAMGDVFVGIVIAIGVFLISYKGHAERPQRFRLGDFETSLIAGTAAIFVALFPTSFAGDTNLCLDTTNDTIAACGTEPGTTILTGLLYIAGPVHLIAAAVFFLCLAYFCLVLFPMGGKRTVDGQAAWSFEHVVYWAAGWTILACILAIIAIFVFGDGALPIANPIFWAEAVAVYAFAAVWLVKGKMLTRPLGLRLPGMSAT